VGRYNPAGGTSYVLLGPGDVVGEVAFFTEVPQLEVRGGGSGGLEGGGTGVVRGSGGGGPG
jgi:hypothetical protein